MRILRVVVVIICLCGMAAFDRAGAAEGPGTVPPFRDVYEFIRTNLPALSESELNRAAVMGFLGQLHPQVSLSTNGVISDNAALPLLSKSTVLEHGYGFLRVGRVAPGLAKAVREAYDSLRSTSKLEGLIVDLRFAVGQEYAAAVETADLFFKSERPLLKLGETVKRSTAKTNEINLPFAVLINGYTSGAAEALAAMLRQDDGVLLLGNPTAGHAYLFKEYPLGSGLQVRISQGSVAVGEDQILTDKGVAPDIRVAVSPEDEKMYFEDPYKTPPKGVARSARPGTNELSSAQAANRARHRLNEAELVRMQRDGIDFDTEPPVSAAPQASVPVINDPVLSRGIDLLKGLALALKRR